MSKTIHKAAIYHRVSTVDQDPTAARSELRAAAERYGLTIALDIEETGSGANNSRPGLNQVMDAARRGRVGTVMVWKLDRFGRSTLDLLANLEQLNDAGVRFIAVTQGIDVKPGRDAMSRLLLTMLSGVAEFERDLIRERTRMGLEAARRKGVRLGRPPSPAPATRDVLALRAAGVSWRDVAKRLECSIGMARRVAKKGGQNGAPNSSKTDSANP